VQEASAAIDQLKDSKEGITVKHACKGDSESKHACHTSINKFNN